MGDQTDWQKACMPKYYQYQRVQYLASLLKLLCWSEVVCRRIKPRSISCQPGSIQKCHFVRTLHSVARFGTGMWTHREIWSIWLSTRSMAWTDLCCSAVDWLKRQLFVMWILITSKAWYMPGISKKISPWARTLSNVDHPRPSDALHWSSLVSAQSLFILQRKIVCYLGN